MRKCKEIFCNIPNRISEPAVICVEAGVTKIFNTLLSAMKIDRRFDKRKMLNERRTVSSIYTLMFDQSKQSN